MRLMVEAMPPVIPLDGRKRSSVDTPTVSRPLDLVMRMGMAGSRNWNGNENWNVLGIRPEAVWNPFGITLECGIF